MSKVADNFVLYPYFKDLLRQTVNRKYKFYPFLLT